MIKKELNTVKEPVSGLTYVFLALITLYFLLSVALVRAMVMGIPIRSFLSIFIFFTIFILIPKLFIYATWEMRRVIIVISYAACLGLVVSLFNQTPIDIILRQILEIHIQAFIGLLIGYALLKVVGPKKLGQAFVIMVGLSCIVAVLQSMGVDYAWIIREKLQAYQTADTENITLNTRMRAMGLSFSPVHLGTQLCLAFAVLHMLRVIRHQGQSTMVFHMDTAKILILAILISIASGNRSPILGFLGFMGAYTFYLKPSLAVAALAVFLPIAAILIFNFDVILEYLQQTGIRAFRVGDKSSEGREALRAFGWLLFLEQPFGYGLAFKSIEHVGPFWSKLIDYENAQTVYGNAIHSYYLNILHKYGILILPLIFFPLNAFRRNIHVLLAFLPYGIHIFFHNDGPLQGDFIIWYFIPMAVLLNRYSKSKVMFKNEKN